MKRKNLIVIIVLIFLTITFIGGILSNNFSSKEEQFTTEGMLSIYLQDTDGEYYKQNSSEFPKDKFFNKRNSYCENGSTLDWVNNKLRITSNMSDKCYVYFDFKESNMDTFEKDNPNTLTKDLVDDMYRFYSSDANNYICFGTEEKCTSDSDYMYRIIGISDKDELKLMKNTTIGKYEYNNDTSIETCGENAENCTWGKNTLSIGLNGDYFLTNSKYEYLQNEKWLNLIEDKNWNIGIIGSAPNASYILNKEKENKTINKYKIGIPYLSDVTIAFDGTDMKNCDSENCLSWLPKTSFRILNLARTTSEWGTLSNIWLGWAWNNIEKDSYSWTTLQHYLNIFPVFYTKSALTIASGTGTEDDPYIIDLEKSNQYLNQ